jgi:hypothetical protein
MSKIKTHFSKDIFWLMILLMMAQKFCYIYVEKVHVKEYQIIDNSQLSLHLN